MSDSTYTQPLPTDYYLPLIRPGDCAVTDDMISRFINEVVDFTKAMTHADH